MKVRILKKKTENYFIFETKSRVFVRFVRLHTFHSLQQFFLDKLLLNLTAVQARTNFNLVPKCITGEKWDQVRGWNPSANVVLERSSSAFFLTVFYLLLTLAYLTWNFFVFVFMWDFELGWLSVLWHKWHLRICRFVCQVCAGLAKRNPYHKRGIQMGCSIAERANQPSITKTAPSQKIKVLFQIT